MITTTLFGGLGTQMFIYAMTRALSLRNHVPMAFNLTSGFDTDFQYKRHLELKHLNASLPTSTISTFDYPGGRYVKKLSSYMKRNVMLPTMDYIEEATPYHFQQEFVLEKIKNVYLNGYWQSPLYFEDYSDVIRSEFKITAPIPQKVNEELAYLKSYSRPLVMVGIRRYQEVKHSSFLTEHVCGAEFYRKAMDMMSNMIENPLFVVFSQDQNWVKENISKEFDIYIVKEKSGDLASVSDMFLMQHCDAAIISNSTFYWWGAWLANCERVISTHNFINKDTNCKEWIII